MLSAPYSKLAKIYDKVMSHVNYVEWAAYVSGLLKIYSRNLEKIIDISCGTGQHLLNIKTNSAKLFGSDNSYNMLLKARKNIKAESMNFIAQDAKSLALKNESFDAIIMLYDSINYIFIEDEIIQTFNEISRVLTKNGIFIFDIVTQKSFFQRHS